MLIVFLAFGLYALQGCGVHAGLKIFFEEVDMVEVDSRFFDPDSTIISIVDDDESDANSLSSTLVLTKKLPATVEARFTLMGLSMGKYTLPTGVDISMTLCDILDEPIIMGPFFSVMGFSKDACPPDPGTYSQEGYMLPTEALPDEFPENKYLVYVEITLKGKPLVATNIYINVQSD